MMSFNSQPSAWAMGLALAALAVAVSAEEAKPESLTAPGSACAHGKVDAMTGGHGFAANSPAANLRSEQQAAAAVGAGKGEPQSPPSGAPPSPGGAPPPAAAGTGTSPQAHLTLSGSHLAAVCPEASGTLPAATVKSHKTRSNIQNN